LASQETPKPSLLRWATLRGLSAIFLFLLLSALIEYFVVAYAVNLGIKDENPIQIPGTSLAISPLFHLVPLSAIIALTFSWVCLTNYMYLKTQRAREKRFSRFEKVKKQYRRAASKMSRGITAFFGRVNAKIRSVKVFSYLFSKVSLDEITIKSASALLFAFSALIIVFSQIVYPKLIYHTVSNFYQNNPSTLSLVNSINSSLRNFVETVAPVGWICTTFNNALIAMALNLRATVARFGSLTNPLVALPPVGKYLVFQNFAVWISALAVLLYGLYVQRSYHRLKTKRF